MNNCPPCEKLIYLINFALERDHVTSPMVADHFDCHERTARRLILRLYDMRKDIQYLDIKFDVGTYADKRKLVVNFK